MDDSEKKQYEKYTIVFGMAEKNGKTILKRLGKSKKDISFANISPLMQNHIKKDAIIYSDQSNVYKDINIDFAGHKVVNHKYCYVTKTGIHINNIENSWKHFKKMVNDTYFHLSPQHFDRYLDEYVFRWNRKNELGHQLIEDFVLLSVKQKLQNQSKESERSIAA